MKQGIHTKKKLNSVPCSSLEFLKKEKNIDVLVECVEFTPGTVIGEDLESGSAIYIEVVFMPCEVDCETYVDDADYEAIVASFLNFSQFYFRMLDSKSEFSRFEKPFEQI